MKKNYKIILLVTALSAILWSFVPSEKKEDPEKDKLLLDLLTMVLERGHYSPVPIDDNFSKKVYKKYLNNIDPTKRFFIQSDIEEFSKYESSIDDMILNKDLTFFNLTNARLLKRMKESRAIYENILENPFDFTVKEYINVDYDKLPFCESKSDLEDRWRKQLKLSALSSITDKQKLEEDKKKDDSKYELKSFETLEKEVRENSLKSLNEYFDFVEKELDRDDWFAIFLNSIVERFDHHTFYFSPDDKEKFDVSMSGTFQGIGARLQKKNDAVEVSELISGGPAWRGKELEAGDLILKVGQGKEEPLDIAGMRLDDVVKKIKGPKGTEVRLTVKKVDGTIKVISIIRDEVETEETFAKSCIVEKGGKKYGVIYLPKFYISFENKENRDAFKDVAAEIEKLKDRNILILSERIEHLNILYHLLDAKKIKSTLIHGGLKSKMKKEFLKEANSSSIILSTSSFIGEGIDFSHLDAIVLTMPVSYWGRIVQYLGRIGRDGQECIAVDFFDENTPMLRSSFQKRQKGYKRMGYIALNEKGLF